MIDVNRIRRVLTCAAGILVLAACSSTSPVAGTSFQAALGTLRTGSGLGTSMLFSIPVKDPSPVPVVVTVRGPSDWNMGKPLLLDYGLLPPGSSWRWRTSSYGTLPAVDGNYVVSADVGGKRFTKDIELTTSMGLATSAAPVILEATEQSVRGYWLPVEGARSYYVRIYQVTEGGLVDVKTRYSTNTSVDFSGLSLSPGQAYFLGVHAFDVDLTTAVPDVSDSVFNASFGSTILQP